MGNTGGPAAILSVVVVQKVEFTFEVVIGNVFGRGGDEIGGVILNVGIVQFGIGDGVLS